MASLATCKAFDNIKKISNLKKLKIVIAKRQQSCIISTIMNENVKRNGLVYSADMSIVIGLDYSSSEFKGVVPAGPIEIAEEAFSCCALESITLPDTVTKVGSNLFCNSLALESVKLPKDLKQLSPYMFCGCKALTHVDMPNVVEDFTEGLFDECESLPEIPFRAGIKTLYEGTIGLCKSIQSLIIPDTVRTLKKGAIAGCDELTTIVLPANLETFEDGAISDCPKLSRIRITDGCTTFKVDDACRTLQKKSGNAWMTAFTVPCIIENDEVELNENAEVNSIITLDDDVSDEIDEESAMNEAATALFGGSASIAAPAKSNNPETQSTTASITSSISNTGNTKEENVSENTNTMESETMQITTQGMNIINTEPSLDTSEGASADTHIAIDEDDVAKRLSDIMGQEKLYGDDNFTIMDIPEATEEEVEAECLPASITETNDVDESEHIASVELAAPSAGYNDTKVEPINSSSEDISDKVKEAMKDNTLDESVGVTDIKVESADEVAEDAPLARSGVGDTSAEREMMNEVIYQTQKIKQEVIKADVDKQKILFVFAEGLCQTQFGLDFSSKLQTCAKRLAVIHDFTSIFYFHGMDLSDVAFVERVKGFLKNRDCLIACTAGALQTVSPLVRDVANLASIELTAQALENQAQYARSATENHTIKLLIQDIMD